MGKATGYNHGKGGSMHIASLDHGMLGANGIVAAGIPISTGAALGFWVRGSPEVALCFFGDGGANHGSFHEGINFAATLKLPVVFVCENNQYAQYHSVQQDLPIENVADRADAYGIPGVIVDGSDVLAIYGAARTAVERARAGEGPTLIEAKTYRFEGHFLGDPEPYRTREEVAQARKSAGPPGALRGRAAAAGRGLSGGPAGARRGGQGRGGAGRGVRGAEPRAGPRAAPDGHLHRGRSGRPGRPPRGE